MKQQVREANLRRPPQQAYGRTVAYQRLPEVETATPPSGKLTMSSTGALGASGTGGAVLMHRSYRCRRSPTTRSGLCSDSSQQAERWALGIGVASHWPL
jgi:hypothetical protein